MIDNGLIERWNAEQIRLLKLQRSLDPGWLPVRYIGGLDISFDHFAEDLNGDEEVRRESRTMEEENGTLCVACLSVFDLESPDGPSLLEQYLIRSHLMVPYRAGYLAFREVPLYLSLLSQFKSAHPEIYSQTVFMVDGNGTLHPKMFGSACQLGVIAKVRTLGVAKNLLCLPEAGGELNLEYIRSERVKSKLVKKEDFVLLRGLPPEVPGIEFTKDSEGKTAYGAALLASSTSRTPIFVSIGNGVTLDECIGFCLRCTKTRIPEPVRASDSASRAELARFKLLAEAMDIGALAVKVEKTVNLE